MSYGNNQGYGSNRYQNSGYGGGGYAPPNNAPSDGYGPPPGAPPTSGYAPPGGGYGPPPGGPPGGGYAPPSQYGPPSGAPPSGGYGAPSGEPPSGGYGATSGLPGGGYGNSAPPPSNHTRPGTVHRPRPPSQNIDPQLRTWFGAVDQDQSGTISPVELQKALVNGDWTPFDLDTVKMLMNIFDTDRSNTIGFEEFAGLWKYIKDWQGVFRHFDTDRSGTIAGHELCNALDQFGFRLPPHLLQLLERKYGTGSLPTRNNPEGGITFDRFVRCCVVVKALTESFQQSDTDKDGWIQLSYEQFMQMALEAP